MEYTGCGFMLAMFLALLGVLVLIALHGCDKPKQQKPVVDHEEVFGEVSDDNLPLMNEAMKEAMQGNPKAKWVEARSGSHPHMLEVVTHTKPKSPPIKIVTTSTSTKLAGSTSLTASSSSWRTIYDTPVPTPWVTGSDTVGSHSDPHSPTPRTITVPSGDAIVLRTPPFKFKSADFDVSNIDHSTTTLILEDTCNEAFKRLECIKMIAGYEPTVTDIGNHWEITFKKP
jgi:hypothetical protein